MEIIITKHIVKPSSPTPHRFRTHKLSLLDQLAPTIYIPLIFMYENDQSEQQEEISRRLRQSLSEVLTIFYPLSGTIKQKSFVDCDDTGTEFVEARVHARLGQFIQNPKMEDLKQLVPADSSSHNETLLLSVKTSFFDCGGVAVGVCLSHKIADAASLVSFMNAWAASCRGEVSTITHPSFDLALYFPPRDFSPAFEFTTKERITTKRLVFDGEKLEKLRKEASSDEVKNPTKVEAVSGFMWRNFIEASPLPGKWSWVASHSVNLRPRAAPPLPDHAFGNCVAGVFAVTASEEDDISLLVSELRAAIRAMDDDYINNAVKGGDYLAALDHVDDNSKFCLFSSWRFPVYDVDFGWGKPLWVCTPGTPNPNLVVLMDTPDRDGIEAWVNIPDDHFFQILQANYNKLIA